jgi:hypothetical protein
MPAPKCTLITWLLVEPSELMTGSIYTNTSGGENLKFTLKVVLQNDLVQ